jgi:ankyrin repeat protein
MTTQLMLASANGNLSMIKSLLQSGAAVNGACPLGYTALMSAVMEMKVEAARLLLGAGANRMVKAKDGMSALAFAQMYGGENSEMVLLLREAGCSTPSAASASAATGSSGGD